MGTPMQITPGQVITVAFGGAAAVQNLWDAVDIGAFDYLDLELVVTSISFTMGTQATVGLATGMQIQAEDGWVNAATANASYHFSTNVTAATTLVKSFGGQSSTPLLRYVRWMVVGTATGTGTIQFYIRGMARRTGPG